jgi:fluoride exporter
VGARVSLTGALAVMAGAAVGGVLRWALGAWLPSGDLATTTLLINVLGCALLAYLPGVLPVHRPLLALALRPGLLGGFTTLSATSEEARALIAAGSAALAATYLLVTLGACVLGVYVGSHLGARVRAAREAA